MKKIPRKTMGTDSLKKKQTEILIIYRADLTAREILRLLHFAVFFSNFGKYAAENCI